jgi:sporulation protein YlmC with PRC-barrel domain
MAVLPLSELPGWRLADPAEDLRGLPVLDENGMEVGIVAELPVDTDTDLIETVVLDNGNAYSVRRLRRDGQTLHLQEF